MNGIEFLRNNFNSPPQECRSIPLWSWNDKLREDEILQQVDGMYDQGMGGFFMHSREGLEDPYLGTEWMSSINTAVEAAKVKGMKAWIYDDDRWPSGAAGGLVAASNPKLYGAKAVTMQVAGNEILNTDNDILAVFRAVVKDNALFSCRQVHLATDNREQVGTDESLLVFRMELSGPSDWYNDNPPPDNLNPQTVAEFIHITHEHYRNELSSEFGKTIPGFFTDEPNIADLFAVYPKGKPWLPWTIEFQDSFKQKKGYDLIDVLPFLFFEGEKSAKTRHDYWHFISDRFCESYTRQLSEWCAKHNLLFTGHYMFENDLGYGTRVNGSIMPHFRYMDIPGIDILAEQTEEYLTVKQCTSVANQYRKKWAISEMYGCTGWDFTFEGQKWLGDWQFVLGINLRCQHHSMYSLKGGRKRDFPPFFNYNTSWWKYNHIAENYFSRLTLVLSQGEAVRDVLLLHPASTIWTMLGSSPTEDLSQMDLNMGWLDEGIVEINKIGERFNRLIQTILAVHYDLDLGDETIIQEKGKIENGKFYVNLAGYSVVVLPPIRSLFSSTVNLLQQFLDNGGKVITVQSHATMVDGEESNELAGLFAHPNVVHAAEPELLPKIIEAVLNRKVSIRNARMTEAQQFLYMLRDLSDSYVLFVVNNDRSESCEVEITLDLRPGSIEEWDPLTGSIKEIKVSLQDDKMKFIANFGPAGSKLFLIRKNSVPKLEKSDFAYRHPHRTKKIYSALGPVCSFTRTMLNSLTLDQCSYSMNAGKWSSQLEVWEAQRNIRETLGMRQIYNSGLPQRYKWTHESHPNDGTPIHIKFIIDVQEIPQTDTFLVLEDPQYFTIQVNRCFIENKPVGWYMDRCLQKIRLPQLIQGMNEIVLSCSYLNKMEMEDCYLVGDFGVNVNRQIVKEAETLRFGDWCMQGYFHYCGSMIYHLQYDHKDDSNKKTLLRLGDYSAVIIEVSVNGQPAGHIPWRSESSLDLTALLNKGSNQIDIEVMGSPRNLFGPLHELISRNSRIDSSSFRRQGSLYTSEYVLKPYGLLGQIIMSEE